MSITTQSPAPTLPSRSVRVPRRVTAALIALALIGVVTLAIGNAVQPAQHNVSASAAQSLPVPPPPVVPKGYVRDPTTHQLLRVPAATTPVSPGAVKLMLTPHYHGFGS